MDIHEQVYELCRDALRADGRLRFFTDWDRELSEHLVAVPWSEMTLTPTNTPQQRPRRTYHPVRKVRSFDYAALRNTHPRLYRESVTEAAPDVPVRIRFDAAGRRTSREWNEYRAAGWARAAQQYPKRSDRPHSPRDAAARLWTVRQQRKHAAATKDDARAAIAALFAAEKTTLSGRHDGLLRIVPAPVRATIDLDAAERHPELARFIRYTERAAYTSVWFQTVTADDDAYDDGDDASGVRSRAGTPLWDEFREMFT